MSKSPQLFLRYVVDNISAASRTHNETVDFLHFAAKFHPVLKFTWSISDEILPFLDFSVSLSGDKHSTGIFFKPTNSPSTSTALLHTLYPVVILFHHLHDSISVASALWMRFSIPDNLRCHPPSETCLLLYHYELNTYPHLLHLPHICADPSCS